MAQEEIEKFAWTTSETQNLVQEEKEEAGPESREDLETFRAVTRRKLSGVAGKAQQTGSRLFHWGEPHTWSNYIAFQEIWMLPPQSG